MGPVFLISLAMSGFAFSFIQGVPLVQSKALAIQKDFETHDHQNPKAMSYNNKPKGRSMEEAIMNRQGEANASSKDGLATKLQLNDGLGHKGSVSTGWNVRRIIRRCFYVWMRCPKAKAQPRKDRNQKAGREGLSKQHGG